MQRRHRLSAPGATVLCLAAALETACFKPFDRGPDLHRIYARPTNGALVERNPVIVIPGVMGSSLVDEESGRAVWGAFTGKYADPRRAEGGRLVALPMRENAALAELTDGVRPDGVLDELEARILGLPVRFTAYDRTLDLLGAGGYRTEPTGSAGTGEGLEEGVACFPFAYDWRRDISETAAQLGRFIEDKRAALRARRGAGSGAEAQEVRFDIVAHSMGGLVARYYLRYGADPLPDDGSLPALTWAGTRDIERAVLIAPPNAGAYVAIRNLVRGVELGPGLPHYAPAIVGTMPAAYQILPRERHRVLVDADDPERRYDPYDPQVWAQAGWGLADPRQDRVLERLLPDVEEPEARRRIALDHQRKCLARARQFAEAMDRYGSPPEGTLLFLIAGDATDTPAVGQLDPRTGKLSVLERRPGDGSVLRSSALLDERLAGEWTLPLDSPIAWTQAIFVDRGHLWMTRDRSLTDNVLHLLLERP